MWTDILNLLTIIYIIHYITKYRRIYHERNRNSAPSTGSRLQLLRTSDHVNRGKACNGRFRQAAVRHQRALPRCGGTMQLLHFLCGTEYPHRRESGVAAEPKAFELHCSVPHHFSACGIPVHRYPCRLSLPPVKQYIQTTCRKASRPAVYAADRVLLPTRVS